MSMHTVPVRGAARVAALLAALSVACGPGKADDSQGQAATDGATTDTDSAPTGGPAQPAVCDAAADPADPLGALDVCEDFAAELPGADMEIGFINLRDEAVIVLGGTSCSGEYFQVKGQPGGRPVHWPYDCGEDPPICDSLLAGGDLGCKLICRIPAPIRIEPGGRFSTTWAPLLVITAELPASCSMAEPMAAQACAAARRPTAGAYTLETFYVPANDCEGVCTCEPGPEGWCVLDNSELVLSPPASVGKGEYDGVCTVADIVIQ